MSVGSYRHQIVQFSSGLLVFSRDALVERIEKLNGLVPEQVLCDSGIGVFRDYGYGIYAYLPSGEFSGLLELRCLIEGVPLRVECHLLSEPPMTVPERFHITQSISSPVGYSILSDGTVVISRHALKQLAIKRVMESQNRASAPKTLSIYNLFTATPYYHCKLTKEFCFISAPYTDKPSTTDNLCCDLVIQVIEPESTTTFELALTLHFTLLSEVIVKTDIKACRRNTLDQVDLIGSPHQFESPIVYADNVYSFSSQSFLTRLQNGSFRHADGDSQGYIYLLTDAVETIAIGLFIPHSKSISIQASLMASNKWCDIEVNKQDLIASSIVHQRTISIERLTFEHSDLVQIKSESEGDLTLSSVNRSKGLGKLSLSGGANACYEGYITFDLVFMPNLIFDCCIQAHCGHYWAISTSEIKALLSRRVRKRIEHIDVNCNDGLVIANDMHSLTLWSVKNQTQTQLNLTLCFEDGTFGFSSITI
ncbi:hypothetical protein VTH8203_02602 [Vibrio thalassae]|uniref:Uncharacterized protein n=2 Tax=Vibrio thalassae TaxID=1243014 RepID=A0A240ELV6_9VIBR|nr:hypothetical protein VTH8203_02602 [Vibrio thalassae]